MGRFQVNTATIPISGTLSEIIPLQGATIVGLWIPVITSANLFIQAAFDPTSTNFVRVQNPQGSGDFTITAATGSKAISLSMTEGAFPFPYARIEASAAQAASRACVVGMKFAGTAI